MTKQNEKIKELYAAFLLLQNTKEVENFCRDLMTEDEIKEFASRFEVAQMLYQGMTQRKVSALSKVSIATVTRVNKWLKNGKNGYKTIISRLHLHNHTNPS